LIGLASAGSLIGISIVLMLAGMGTAFLPAQVPSERHGSLHLGVDFKGGTVLIVRFKQPPPADTLRAAINQAGIKDCRHSTGAGQEGRVSRQSSAPGI